ncbi:TonB-dependent receptor [Paucibacter sp. XJ19-41]|uniref:TonB-dependent receptor n=1 Tax=Paucibacter sp. XJ19-41 TaxID=2927824 RepID=UPI00234A718D|nr:TonB-dependent receptor [Paucibacter sp. XJ19-41]MDC6168580.1 TonB-dependent receptor [Paucibacter sp. XJ19-41]
MNSKRLFFSKTALSAAVALLVAAPAMSQTAPAADSSEAAPRAKDDAVRLGTITIVGEGNKLGAGQMLNEDVAKSRSTVTKAAVEKDRATGNPYQALALLPSINSFNHDATGLFGGGLSVRGFNSDQLGFTINGVPVNDSGNFAVYPQEYVDQENVCTQGVTQGSPDAESPHAGATGGNVSITTCDPEDKRRFRFAQTLGQLDLTRTYVRFDSGRFFDNKMKVFLSYSHTQADKWKGKGKAKKDHIDAAFRYDIDQDNVILGSVVYNRAINNNIYNPSLKELNDNGYNFDYSTTIKARPAPVNGTAQTETANSFVNTYYDMALNPFENAIISVSGSFKVAENTYLKVQPYMWFGLGNGGWSEQALRESSSLIGGAVDINGDGDTLDTWRVARASQTRTQRPGVTAELSTTLGDHYLKAGIWYERASHRQTQPAVQITDAGRPADIWLKDGCIDRADGTCYQGRNADTTSTAYQAYLSDSISFMNDRGMLSLGVRTPHVTRDVTSYENEGSTDPITRARLPSYNIKKSFNDVLPQVGVRFNLDRNNQVFLSVAKNFKAPANFAFMASNVRVLNSTVVPIVDVKPETSIMTDVGYRLQTRMGSLSATVFNSDFKDRQATAYDPNTQVSTYQNIGKTNNRGLELEAGSAPFWGGFTAYGSLTLQKSKVKDDYVVSATSTLPTSGKQMTLTPEQMIGASLQYATGPFYARLKAKYTGKQYATLMNDEEVPAYTVLDLDGGYNFGTLGMLSNTQLRVNISNITNEKYRNPSSGTVSNATAYPNRPAQSVFYYLGAPRFFSVSLSADFN